MPISPVSNITQVFSGNQLVDTHTIIDAIVNANGASRSYNITAAGSSQGTATQLTAVINEVDTITTGGGVALPSSSGKRNTPFQNCVVINNTAAPLNVYGIATGSDSINNVAGSTGIAQNPFSIYLYVSAKPGYWFAINSSDKTTQIVANQLAQSSAYVFHGYAANQLNTDPVFYDRSGINNGVFGANLSVANAWTNAGYVSTIAPSGGATDSVIRIPAVNLDYLGGERLIIWWLGIMATPLSGTPPVMGDGSSATFTGFQLRSNTSGGLQIVLFGPSATAFAGSSTLFPFDGTVHSFGLILDGTTKTFGYWVDEVYDPGLSFSYASFPTSAGIDTKTPNTFNIGTSAPKVAASTAGVAIETRAFALLRIPTTGTMPSAAAMTRIFKQFRANPGNLLLAGAIP